MQKHDLRLTVQELLSNLVIRVDEISDQYNDNLNNEANERLGFLIDDFSNLLVGVNYFIDDLPSISI